MQSVVSFAVLLVVGTSLLVSVARGDGLTVIKPAALRSSFFLGLAAKQALFGRNDLSLTGRLVVVNYSLCSRLDHAERNSINLHNTPPGVTWSSLTANSTVFLLTTDTGHNCTFAQRSRNAAAAGASVLLVARSGTAPYASASIPGEWTGNIVTYTVSAGDVGPIIPYVDAEASSGVVELSTAYPGPFASTVNVTLFVPLFPLGVPTEVEFFSYLPFRGALEGGAITVVPASYIVDGSRHSWCTRSGRSCALNCTNGGRYCIFGNTSLGVYTIREAVRRVCLWRLLTPLAWRNYVGLVEADCQVDSQLDACAYNMMSQQGVPVPAVEACVRGSSTEGDPFGASGSNSILDWLVRLSEEALFNVPVNGFVSIKVGAGDWRPAVTTCKGPDRASCFLVDLMCSGLIHPESSALCTCPLRTVTGPATCGVPTSAPTPRPTSHWQPTATPTAMPATTPTGTPIRTPTAAPLQSSAGGSSSGAGVVVVVVVAVVCVCVLVGGGVFWYRRRRRAPGGGGGGARHVKLQEMKEVQPETRDPKPSAPEVGEHMDDDDELEPVDAQQPGLIRGAAPPAYDDDADPTSTSARAPPLHTHGESAADFKEVELGM